MMPATEPGRRGVPSPIPEAPDEVKAQTLAAAGCLGSEAGCHRVRRRRPVRVPDTWVPPEPVTVPPIQIDLGALRRYHTHDALSDVRGSETRTAKKGLRAGRSGGRWRWTRSAG
jgi:hypothetical protein